MKLFKEFLLSLVLVFSAVAVLAESPFSIAPRVEHQNGVGVLRVAFGLPTNHVLYADKLAFRLADGETPVVFNLPESTTIRDRFSRKEKRVFARSFEASYALAALPETQLKLSVHFQGCDQANCYFPEDRTYNISPSGSITEVEEAAGESATPAPAQWRALAAGFAVAVRGSGYLGERKFLRFLDKAESGQAGSGAPVRTGFWGILLTMCLIVLGGVALNLTPCILPMIPINLAIIGAGAQAGSRKRGFGLGATYAAGMALAYGVLGVVVVLTGSKFGTLNSSPWFNLGIAAVFLVLAIAMFDLVNIDLSRFQNSSAGSPASSKSKFILAYSMGTVAALLAGACVAPVVISVLLQATALHAKGIVVGLFLPFLLGLGMGLPWPFAGAGLSFLPKPGKWMMRVKHGFGALIVCFAAYYGYLSFSQFQTESAIVAHAAGSPDADDSTRMLGDDLSRALQKARADGRPVFIDLWASWCKNCSAMEHTTFASAAVKQRLLDFHEVRLQMERPNQSPAKEILDHFNVLGLPSYVVLTPKAQNAITASQPEQRIEPGKNSLGKNTL